MNGRNFINKTVSIENANRAKKLGYSMNEYINYLIALSEQGKTTEQEQLSARQDKTEGTVASLAEALKHQRYLTDTQSLKIDELIKMTGTLIELQTKLINAYGADVEFIQALKKEITE